MPQFRIRSPSWRPDRNGRSKFARTISGGIKRFIVGVAIRARTPLIRVYVRFFGPSPNGNGETGVRASTRGLVGRRRRGDRNLGRIITFINIRVRRTHGGDKTLSTNGENTSRRVRDAVVYIYL